MTLLIVAASKLLSSNGRRVPSKVSLHSERLEVTVNDIDRSDLLRGEKYLNCLGQDAGASANVEHMAVWLYPRRRQITQHRGLVLGLALAIERRVARENLCHV